MKFEQTKILAVAFFAGFAVMALELSASRLLAPFFGTSLFVWTNIIGVVLAALTLGYWLGGKWADKGAGFVSVGWAFAVAGCWSLAVPFLIRLITQNINIQLLTGNTSTILVIFVISCISFALPVGLLGAINPIFVKRMVDLSSFVGRSSGSVAAWSTIGSIVGTFTAGLVLIPNIGTRKTMLSISLLLLVLSLCTLWDKKRQAALVLVLAVMLGTGFYDSAPIKPNSGLIYEGDTPYHYVQILETSDGVRSMVFNAGFGVQSVYVAGGGAIGFGYFDKFAKLSNFFQRDGQQPLKILMIGLAGGEILHQLQAREGDKVSLEAVEIDSKVVELSKKYFDLEKLPVKIHTEDARTFLAKLDEKFDIIIVDAYQNELYLPWQLTTREFWELVKQNLDANGIAAANLLVGLPSSPLLEALQNTAASVFDNVVVGQTGFANYFLIAGQDASLKEKARSVEEFAKNSSIKFNPNATVLTDDLAPVEQLAHKALKEMWGE